jgi:hypothetical protein
MYNLGTLTVSDSTLSGKSGGGGSGGGMYNLGTLTVTNSTLSGNSATGINDPSGSGGGIWNDGTLTVSNSTLSGNSAYALNYGGGIWNDGTLTVSNSTLSGNDSADGFGGGINNTFRGTVNMRNTIIARNAANRGGSDVDGSFNSQGYNLIGDGSRGSGFVSSDMVGTFRDPIDPRLGPLKKNGGPTQTMALLPGSPALNAGDPTQLGTTDQRGVARTGGVNIGAYEASATAFLLSAPDTVSSGVPFDVTLTAVDPFGQVAVGYLGTITFSSSDPDTGVVLPADYAFQPSDGGQVAFPGGVTLITPGDQTLTVTDTADNTLTGSVVVTVSSAAPGTEGHGLGAPPSRSDANSAPAQPPTRGEPSGADVRVLDRWSGLFPAWDEVGLTVPGLTRPSRGDIDTWLADLVGREDLRGSVG